MFCAAVPPQRGSGLMSFCTAVDQRWYSSPEFITCLPCDVSATPGGLVSVAPVQDRVSLQTTGVASWLGPGISQGRHRQLSTLGLFFQLCRHRRQITKVASWWGASSDGFLCGAPTWCPDSSLEWNVRKNATGCAGRADARSFFHVWAEKNPLTYFHLGEKGEKIDFLFLRRRQRQRQRAVKPLKGRHKLLALSPLWRDVFQLWECDSAQASVLTSSSEVHQWRDGLAPSTLTQCVTAEINSVQNGHGVSNHAIIGGKTNPFPNWPHQTRHIFQLWFPQKRIPNYDSSTRTLRGRMHESETKYPAWWNVWLKMTVLIPLQSTHQSNWGPVDLQFMSELCTSVNQDLSVILHRCNFVLFLQDFVFL